MPAQQPAFRAYAGSDPPRFVNEVELECAKMLDYYGVPWEYEPTTFVLERDPDGRVTSAFTPDFYLPEQDLYVEVTVMRQSLVTRKNRKLRELRRQYPEVNVKLFYRRDIERLAQRFQLAGSHTSLLDAARRQAPRRRANSSATSTCRGRRSHARVAGLGARAGAGDYAGREPLLVAPLKSSVVFAADLSRALPLPHALDFIEIAPLSSGRLERRRAAGQGSRPTAITGRDVIVVEDIVDTGLTLHFLARTLELRDPASLAAVTLLDRPYRRVRRVDPLRYVGLHRVRGQALRRVRARAGRALARAAGAALRRRPRGAPDLARAANCIE